MNMSFFEEIIEPINLPFNRYTYVASGEIWDSNKFSVFLLESSPYYCMLSSG